MDAQLALYLDATRPALEWSALSADELVIGYALQWGSARAVQVRELAERTGIPARRVQDVVQQLLLRHRWPIGTSMRAPYGNYLIDTADELEATTRLLRDRGISELQRAAALRRMSLQDYVRAIQTDLEEAS
jgi:hypothetical protein